MNTIKICFIDAVGITEGLNVGLAYLASSLIEEGYTVKVVDLNNYQRIIKNRIAAIRNYDIVGLSVKSFTYHSACEISEMLGRKDLICGGPHSTLDGFNFLRDNHNFSIGVIGEGEKTMVELADAIKNNDNLEEIDGIIYRNNKNEIIINKKRAFLADLDSLPYPNYEVFDSFNGTITHYPLITSRGCPYSCIYCCVGKISGKKWRFRHPEKMISELEFAKSSYNSKDFMILDDNFTQDINRAKEFCQLLIEYNTNMNWNCSNGIRASKLDEELVALMKDSGCDEVSLGIESLDYDIFNNIKKGEKLEDIKHAINLLNKYRIKVVGFFIIGLPGDSLSKTKSSIEYGRRLNLERAYWNMLVPYPGTEAWQWVNKNAKIIRDWRKGFHFGTEIKPVFETQDFSEKEKIYAHNLANIKYKNYMVFFDERRPFLSNMFNMFRLILLYDLKNLPSHLLYGLKNIKRVYNKAISKFRKAI